MDPRFLDYLLEAQELEKRQNYSFALEPADKQANSQVLVLGFSQAPPSTSCMPQPFPALQPAVPARKYLHHRV